MHLRSNLSRIAFGISTATFSFGCGTDWNFSRSSDSISASASSNAELALAVGSSDAAFQSPIVVYGTGRFKLNGSIFQLEPFEATFALASPDGSRLNNLSVTLPLAFHAAVKAKSPTGLDVSLESLSERKVFVVGTFDPSSYALRQVVWVQEVPTSPGGCGYESEVFRTTATGCRWIGKEFPDIMAFTKDINLLPIEPLRGSPERIIANGQTAAPLTQGVRIDLGRENGTGSVVRSDVTEACPLPMVRGRCPVATGNSEHIGLICAQYGPDFRLPRLAEISQIARLPQLKQLFHTKQTVIDFSKSVPINGFFLQEPSGRPYLHLVNEKQGKPNRTAFGRGIVMCMFDGDRSKEISGGAKLVRGSVGLAGRSGVSLADGESIFGLTEQKILDAEISGFAKHSCNLDQDAEVSFVARANPTFSSFYLATLRQSANNKIRLIIQKNSQGVWSDLAIRDLPYPLAQDIRVSTTGIVGKPIPLCFAKMIFTVTGDRLHLRLTTRYGKSSVDNYNYGMELSLSAVDANALPAGFVGVRMINGKPASPFDVENSAFGDFRVRLLGSSESVAEARNPPSNLIVDLNGAIPTQPSPVPSATVLPVPGARAALQDDSAATFVVGKSSSGWIHSGHGGFSGGLHSIARGGIADAAAATFTLSVGEPGNYIIAASWIDCSTCSTETPFVIEADGARTVSVKVNQTERSKGTKDGAVEFESIAMISARENVEVVIKNDFNGKQVQADAVRLSRVN